MFIMSFCSDVGGPNVKLLYDILNISSPQINKAVLFVTKSTLVCETPEDARRVAYEIDRKTHDVIIIITIIIIETLSLHCLSYYVFTMF